MNIIKATWKNGQVVLDRNADWPEGRRLVVVEEPVPEIEFMTEDQQSDDPVAIQKWIEEVRSLPPLAQDPLPEADRIAWQQKMKAFNIEAVRRQMEEGIR